MCWVKDHKKFQVKIDHHMWTTAEELCATLAHKEAEGCWAKELTALSFQSFEWRCHTPMSQRCLKGLHNHMVNAGRVSYPTSSSHDKYYADQEMSSRAGQARVLWVKDHKKHHAN